MRLSNFADYAVVLLAAAVRDGGARLTSAELAERTRVPVATAQKLVGKLAGAGLLVSSRGAGGGFRLARDPSAISLAEIVEAVEGPIALTTCVDHGRDDCALDHHCQVRPHWGAVNDALRGALAGVSLAELATPLLPTSPTPFVSSDVETHVRAQPRTPRLRSVNPLDFAREERNERAL